jgi:2-oxoglutarate dehydrogenase E2 component (dihydrolipoamide succinyltransferase)
MITEFKMPKMGESITEATIISWLKSVGDFVNAEETIVEVATDKVDNDLSSPVSGVITEIRFQKDDVVEIGTVLALIDSEAGSAKLEDGSNKEQTKVEVSSKTQSQQAKTNN